MKEACTIFYHNARPGVMLYFERLRFLSLLDDAQKGRLFQAILDYAENGVVPDFFDPAVHVAWEAIRPAIDQDAIRYEEICARNRENAAKRWHPDATACDRMPNTNTNS
ncbi:MAG: DUF6291 domain-containing protein [Clostridia bacterium]